MEKHKFYRWKEKSSNGTKMVDIIFTLAEDWVSDKGVEQYLAKILFFQGWPKATDFFSQEF